MLDQVKVLNVFYEKERKLLLSLILKKVLAMNVVNGITAIIVIDDKINRVFEY